MLGTLVSLNFYHNNLLPIIYGGQSFPVYISKIVTVENLMQIDLPKVIESDFIGIANKLNYILEINIIKFGNSAVIRHPLTAKIIDAYE